MATQGGIHRFRCPCYDDQTKYHKIVDLKDTGLVIYRKVMRDETEYISYHKILLSGLSNMDRSSVECTPSYHTNYEEEEVCRDTQIVAMEELSLPETTKQDLKQATISPTVSKDIFILHNTKDVEILSADIIPAFDKNNINCPRCRQIFENAQSLLQTIPKINKNDIMGICDHCRRKISRSPCEKCDEVVRKFVSSRDEVEDTKKHIKEWLSKIHQLLKNVVINEKNIFKPNTRASSGIDLNKMHHNSPVSLRQPEVTDLFYSENLRTGSTKTLHMSDRSYSLPGFSKIRKKTKFVDYLDLEKSHFVSSKHKRFYSKSYQDLAYPVDDTISSLELGRDDYSERKSSTDKTFKKIFMRAVSDMTPGKYYSEDSLIPIRKHRYPSEETLKLHDKRLPGMRPIAQQKDKLHEKRTFEERLISHRKYSSEEILPSYDKRFREDKSLAPKEKLRPYEKYSSDERLMSHGKYTPEGRITAHTGTPEESTRLHRKHKSEETIKTSISGVIVDHLKQDFGFFFPHSVDDKIKPPKKRISSSQLIKDTADMLKARAEEERLRREEEQRKKREEQERKAREREQRRLLREEAKKKAEEAKRLAEEAKRLADEEERRQKEIKRLAEEEAKRLAEEERKRLAEEQKILKSKKQPKTEPVKKIKEPPPERKRKKSFGPVEKSKVKKPSPIKTKTKEPPSVKTKVKGPPPEKPKKDPLPEKPKAPEPLPVKSTPEIPKPSKQKEIIPEKPRPKELPQEKTIIKETPSQQPRVMEPLPEKTKVQEPIPEMPKVIESVPEKPKQSSPIPEQKEKPKKEKPEPIVKEKEEIKAPEKPKPEPKPEPVMADDFKKLLEEQAKMKEERQRLKKQKEEEDRKAREEAEKKMREMEQQAKSAANKAKKEEADVEKPPEKKQEPTTMKELNIKQIKVREPSGDDLILKLVKLKQDNRSDRTKKAKDVNIKNLIIKHKAHKYGKDVHCIVCTRSDIELDLESILNWQDKVKMADIIIGPKIFRYKPPIPLVDINQQQNEMKTPIIFKTDYNEDTDVVKKKIEEIPKVISDEAQQKSPPLGPAKLTAAKGKQPVEQEVPKGIVRYALSDRSFIDKGWTMLPIEKVVRKMNVYRMRPAQPEFDWFEHNKNKRLMTYDTGERLAEFDDNGRGRWYYKNGRLALDYYDAEEINAQQRFVVYSSGEPDERGRSRPFTILATFDYLGNGIVFDHSGKIRLKYNQTEGVVLDRAIGPVSHWKWHTLNDPPVLQQVMIDTQMPLKDPDIIKLGGPGDNKARPDNEEMLAIEFDNFIKEKSKKLTQKFKPFQIKMKALKINESFSLKVLDQATVYLIFRDGSANLKLNIGMILDHKEIVDTDTAEVGEVSNSLERLPARTDSIAGLQRSVAHAQRVERLRVERERRLRPPEPCGSADRLAAAAARPLRPPFRTDPEPSPSATTTYGACKCRKPSSSNLYYDTRLF